MRLKSCMLAALANGIIAGWALTGAQASGRLFLPPLTQQVESYDACIAALRAFYDEDQKKITAKKTDARGNTHEMALDTKGVEQLAPGKARYDATIWAHNGHFMAKFKQTETQHSFVHRVRECDGNTLRTSEEDGFTMSTLEPAQAPAKSH